MIVYAIYGLLFLVHPQYTDPENCLTTVCGYIPFGQLLCKLLKSYF